MKARKEAVDAYETRKRCSTLISSLCEEVPEEYLRAMFYEAWQCGHTFAIIEQSLEEVGISK